MAGKQGRNGKTRAFAPVNYKTARLAREKQKREMEQQKKEKIIFVLFVVIILVMILFAILIFRSILSGDPEAVSNDRETVQTEPVTDTESEDVSSDFENVRVAKEEIYKGNLLLIDSSHPYKKTETVKSARFDGSDGTTDPRTVPAGANASFYLQNKYETTLGEAAFKALDKMAVDFYAATGNNDLCISTGGGYNEAATDEHATGRAVDLLAMPSNGVFLSFDDETVKTNFDWLRQNYYKYGFVLGEADGCESNKCYHFLYVGEPHAQYMYENDLDLAGYLDTLRTKHAYGSTPLSITSAGGAKYQVYYVASVGDAMDLPVPANNDYTYSGDNVGGFLVTVTVD